MPESRGRRPRKPIPQAANSTTTNKPAKKQTKEVASTAKPEPKRFRPLELWKNVWAVLGPVLALTSFAFLLWPQIKIDATANPNPADPVSAPFIVTNVGNVPVYNVHFSCALGVGGGVVGPIRAS